MRRLLTPRLLIPLTIVVLLATLATVGWLSSPPNLAAPWTEAETGRASGAVAPRNEQALAGGEARQEERVIAPGSATADAAAGERPELREQGGAEHAPGREAGSGKGPGGGVSSAELGGAPSSHSRPTSPGASRR